MPRNRRLGAEPEDRAAKFLSSLGYTLVARNYHARAVEVDVIALDGDTLVFVEVKARRDGALVGGEESVTPAKMRRLITAAEGYLCEVAEKELNVRFDVVVVVGENISHYVDAFRPA
jgi:putative endonuclease